MDGFNNRMVGTGQRIYELEKRAIEIVQSKQQRENKLWQGWGGWGTDTGNHGKNKQSETIICVLRALKKRKRT